MRWNGQQKLVRIEVEEKRGRPKKSLFLDGKKMVDYSPTTFFEKILQLRYIAVTVNNEAVNAIINNVFDIWS